MQMIKTLSIALTLGTLVQAQTINLHGKVTSSTGQGISGAIVTLMGRDLKDTTDGNGEYAITQSTTGVSPVSRLNESIVFNRGMMELHLAAPAPVKIEIFDLSANLLKEKTFSEVPAGKFQWNINEDLNTSNMLVVRATIGGRVSTFRYSPLLGGRYSVKSSAEPSNSRNALALATVAAAVGSLEFKATGYNTKVVDISSYEETVNVTLGTADRWGGLNNPPIKSSGCGKTQTALPKSGTYQISTVPGRGQFIIDIPANYDNNKPYRLVFGNHCMNGTAIRVAEAEKGTAGDDLSAFYSIKTMATKDNIQNIYVAMQGDAGGTWNAANDPKFWSDVLVHVENNLCIDTTRVFVAGFSFGAMFTYALSLAYPERIRAVATYAPANWNFDPQPARRNIPIAYYQTTGTGDNLCGWVNNAGQKKGGKYCLLQHMEDNGCTSTEADIKIASGSTHVTTEFKGCKEGYPVKFGSHTGGHQAVHTDPGTNFSWIEKETWEFFKQF